MVVSQVLRARPVNVQVRHRASFVPPRFDLFETGISVPIVTRLAETYGLKSTGIIVNQNAASTQYLSFRYILPNDPIRYFDASIGIDQSEIVFFNPSTVAELKEEVGRFWKVIFDNLKPTVTENFFEAALHCAPEGLSTMEFLNRFVNVQDSPGIYKGFSVTVKGDDIDTVARINLNISDSVPDGLWVQFVYVSKRGVPDMLSLDKLFSAILVSYRSLQNLAQIELVEPT